MAEYIERERLIGSLEDVIADYKDEHTFSTDFAATVVIDILNNIVKCQPAADVEPVQEWIPVNDERKPKEGEDVLVAVFDGYDTYTDMDCLMRDGKWCFETENYKVTHWMEKPKPPKGE